MDEFSDLWMCNYVDNQKQNHALHPNLQLIWKCNWEHFMRLPVTSKLLLDVTKNASNDDDFEIIGANQTELLAIAISSLQLFVQQNFIGPNIEFVSKGLPSSNELRVLLQVNGVELNGNVEKPELLLLSMKIVKKLLKLSPTYYVLQWWYLRILYIYNEVLDEPCEVVYDDFCVYSEELLKQLDNLPSIETRVLVLLEISQQYLAYKRVLKSEDHLTMARNLLNAKLDVTGALGMRTKFQQKPLPLLSLKIEGDFEKLASNDVTHSETLLPKLLRHDDDTRLEKVQFQSEEDNTIKEIPSLIQLLVLATVHHIQKSQPKDRLANEELEPYLMTLLYQTKGPWSSRIATLLMNINMEASHKRTVDRSLRQCEEISKIISATSVPSKQRLSFVYASFTRPRWFVQVQLADLMLSLGLLKSALECYLKIQKWEEVIVCYTLLELRHKAADVIRQELEKKPTVELYCLLGDATDDPQFYEEAWRLSKEKSGRVQRHWGGFYFARRDYEKCISHLQKSLELNNLQETVWSRLGFAAIQLGKWELAAKAYRMYTFIEPNGFEGWNNLARAYTQLHDTKRAHKVLQEAIKCNYDNCKVWENFLTISMMTDNFEDILRSNERLIDLKGKYFDRESLHLVVHAIAENVPDANNLPTLRLKKRAQDLLGHLCTLLPSEGKLWEFSSVLCIGEPLAQAQKLQRAFRCYTQAQSLSWSNNPKTARKVLEVCQQLCIASLAGFADHKSSERSLALSQLSSARLSAQGSIRALSEHNYSECSQLTDELSGLLDQIKDVLLKNL
ncbi:tetratricopeptide repeat protein 27 [Bradysia coprophila]|uniref:tetratricopeptide repeat protein 27 n=1 Tax=Bradysia coprophila TaxID=38358 RepID=UPI00187DB845|nr:tetratricopeptide repeat protein 27 [Bradysia coprophila]